MTHIKRILLNWLKFYGNIWFICFINIAQSVCIRSLSGRYFPTFRLNIAYCCSQWKMSTPWIFHIFSTIFLEKVSLFKYMTKPDQNQFFPSYFYGSAHFPFICFIFPTIDDIKGIAAVRNVPNSGSYLLLSTECITLTNKWNCNGRS